MFGDWFAARGVFKALARSVFARSLVQLFLGCLGLRVRPAVVVTTRVRWHGIVSWFPGLGAHLGGFNSHFGILKNYFRWCLGFWWGIGGPRWEIVLCLLGAKTQSKSQSVDFP